MRYARKSIEPNNATAEPICISLLLVLHCPLSVPFQILLGQPSFIPGHHSKLKPSFCSSPSQVLDSLKWILFCRGVFPSWFFTFPSFPCKWLLSPASKGMLVPQFPENLRNLTFSRMEQFLCYLKITSPFRCQQSLIVHLFIDRETSSPPFFPAQHLWDRGTREGGARTQVWKPSVKRTFLSDEGGVSVQEQLWHWKGSATPQCAVELM